MPRYVKFTKPAVSDTDIPDDPALPRCAFNETEADCQAAATHGIYAGYNNNIVARVCAKHVAEGKRQIQSQHPDWILNAAPLPAANYAPSHKATDWSKLWQPRRWDVRDWIVAVIAVLVVVGGGVSLAVNGSGSNGDGSSTSSSSGPGTQNEVLWNEIRSDLRDHLQTAQQNQTAGNIQGVLNAKTKLVADCQRGGKYDHGSGPIEGVVRDTCNSLGYPVP